MKKKILAGVALALILAMESVTVFATEGNSPTTTNGAVPQAAVIDEVNNVFTTTDGSSFIGNTQGTQYSFASTPAGAIGDVGTQSMSNTTIETPGIVQGKVSNDAIQQGASKFEQTKQLASQYNATAEESVLMDLSSDDGVAKKVTFNVPGITSENLNTVAVFNYRDSVWRTVPKSLDSNGRLVADFDHFSPVLIVKFDKPVPGVTTDVDTYTTTTATTVSGDVSPKTAETYPYAATTAVVALICVYACTKKLAKK